MLLGKPLQRGGRGAAKHRIRVGRSSELAMLRSQNSPLTVRNCISTSALSEVANPPLPTLFRQSSALRGAPAEAQKQHTSVRGLLGKCPPDTKAEEVTMSDPPTVSVRTQLRCPLPQFPSSEYTPALTPPTTTSLRCQAVPASPQQKARLSNGSQDSRDGRIHVSTFCLMHTRGHARARNNALVVSHLTLAQA